MQRASTTPCTGVGGVLGAEGVVGDGLGVCGTLSIVELGWGNALGTRYVSPSLPVRVVLTGGCSNVRFPQQRRLARTRR